MKLDVTLPEFCGTLWSEAAPHLTSVPLSLKRISMGPQWGAGALLHNYAGSGSWGMNKDLKVGTGN